MAPQKLREIIEKEMAVKAMGILYSMIRIYNRLSKEKMDHLRFYKIKTKNYHVRVMLDQFPTDQFLIVRPRGFLKEWVPIEKQNIPGCLAKDIFDESCPAEKRKRLVSKVVELKAFW